VKALQAVNDLITDVLGDDRLHLQNAREVAAQAAAYLEAAGLRRPEKPEEWTDEELLRRQMAADRERARRNAAKKTQQAPPQLQITASAIHEQHLRAVDGATQNLFRLGENDIQREEHPGRDGHLADTEIIVSGRPALRVSTYLARDGRVYTTTSAPAPGLQVP